jgi:peroxiredoxin
MLSLLIALACAPKPAAQAPVDAAAPVAAPAAPVAAEAVVGQAAPDFTLTDVTGASHTLSAYKGKTVVLEWFNPDCPFVKYAHGPGGPLVGMPKTWIDQGVVWLAINSGAEGKQGAGKERNAAAIGEYAMVNPVLIDGDGAVGRRYAAKTTPHMFIVDAQGVLVYDGALDNAPLGKVEAEPRQDHVITALTALAAGQPVAQGRTQPYGCSVKY